MPKELHEILADLKESGLVLDPVKGIGRLSLTSSLGGNYPAGVNTTRSQGTFSLEENEEYLFAPFRALSAEYIESRAIDFTKEGILKKSYRLLKGQTIYPNHDKDVLNWIGHVSKSSWDDGTGDVPGGVNAVLAVNKKWNQKTVDGVKSGAIHSVSVSVDFAWEKSHPELGDDFWWHLGETVGKETVRIIVTEITGYAEISLVWQGACPSAKRLFDINDSGEGSGPDGVNQNNKGANKMKLTRSLVLLFALSLAKFGFTGADQSVELDEAGQAMFMDDVTKAYSELKRENEELKKSMTEAFGEGYTPESINSMKEMAENGKKYLAEVRNEALKFAALAEGGKDIAGALKKSIENAGLADALEFRKEFQDKAEKAFPLKCEKCGGNFTRQSASGSEGQGIEANAGSYDVSSVSFKG
jgi:hypothetical protein